MSDIDTNVIHFNNKEPHLMSEILYDELSLSLKEFNTLLTLGAIYVDNKRQIKDKFILQISQFRVHTKPRRYNCNYPWTSFIIFENDFFLVLNKPSGIPSHPSVDNSLENSLTQTSLARGFPLFVTHRLDTLTSGLIVYAKKTSFVKSFNLQLQERSIKKKYVALVESTQIFPNKLTHFMNPAAGTPKLLSDKMTEGWPLCQLEILEQKNISPKFSWIKINLLTGRTHQIRAQLSHMKAPIVGDLIYGAELPFQKNAIALRSCEIEFNSPNAGAEQRVKFNLNEDFSF